MEEIYKLIEKLPIEEIKNSIELEKLINKFIKQHPGYTIDVSVNLITDKVFITTSCK